MKKTTALIALLTLFTTLLAQEGKTRQKVDETSAAYKAMINASGDGLVFPESLEDHVDTTKYSWTERMFIHVDPDCISDEQVDDVPDSVYIMRLRALPTLIDMPFNDAIRKCLDMYVHRRRSLVERMVGIGYNHYFPIFEEALQRYEMPSELKYLACIESALKQNAFSRAKAAGLWQFMPATGMLLGLEVNSFLDERYDLYKSTDAACRYLLQLYKTFNDWPLAIAAYNCGPGNINKAIARSGGRHTFWEIYNFLPAETRSYVPLFIAATYIMTYHCEHNLCATLGELPPMCDTLMVNNMIHFDQISNVLNIPIDQLESLNPQYVVDIVPGSPEKAKSITLPAEKTVEFIQMHDSIMAYKADSLLPHNGELREILTRGKRNSYVASGGNNSIRAGGAKGAAGAAAGDVHIVKKGQTLSYVAKRYGTTVSRLKSLNGMKSDVVREGQRLRVR